MGSLIARMFAESGSSGYPAGMTNRADISAANDVQTLTAMRFLAATHTRLTIDEITAKSGLPRGTTYRALGRLREVGDITWEPGQHGTLRLVDERPRLADGSIDVREWCRRLDEECNRQIKPST